MDLVKSYNVNRLVEKSRFWGQKVDKKTFWLSNVKGRACKLDFTALHIKCCLSLQSARKVDKKSVLLLDPKDDYKLQVSFFRHKMTHLMVLSVWK